MCKAGLWLTVFVALASQAIDALGCPRCGNPNCRYGESCKAAPASCDAEPNKPAHNCETPAAPCKKPCPPPTCQPMTQVPITGTLQPAAESATSEGTSKAYSLGSLNIPFPTLHLPRRFWVQHNQQVNIPVAVSNNTVTTQAVAVPPATGFAAQQFIQGQALVQGQAVLQGQTVLQSQALAAAQAVAPQAANAQAAAPQNLDQIICELKMAKLRSDMQAQSAQAATGYEKQIELLETQLQQIQRLLEKNGQIKPEDVQKPGADQQPGAGVGNPTPQSRLQNRLAPPIAPNQNSRVRLDYGQLPANQTAPRSDLAPRAEVAPKTDQRTVAMENRLDRMEQMLSQLLSKQNEQRASVAQSPYAADRRNVAPAAPPTPAPAVRQASFDANETVRDNYPQAYPQAYPQTYPQTGTRPLPSEQTPTGRILGVRNR